MADESGLYTLNIQASDGQNLGGTVLTVTVVDTIAPVKPLLFAPSPTNDNTPEITGIGEAGSMVVFSLNGEQIGQTQIDANGSYSFVFDTQLGDGSYLIGARSMDQAGNKSEPSQGHRMVIDTVAPEAPTLEGAKLGKLSKPTLAGTAEAKSMVTIYKGEFILGQVLANDQGRYVFVP